MTHHTESMKRKCNETYKYLEKCQADSEYSLNIITIVHIIITTKCSQCYHSGTNSVL